jgi:hypothetical protein
MAQVVECLPSKCETLSSNPVPRKCIYPPRYMDHHSDTQWVLGEYQCAVCLYGMLRQCAQTCNLTPLGVT